MKTAKRPRPGEIYIEDAAAGGEGEAAALSRRAAAPWSPASHSLFPAAARARAALLVLSIYEIHERYRLDSAGATNGIAALDFGHCVLGFAIAAQALEHKPQSQFLQAVPGVALGQSFSRRSNCRTMHKNL